MERLRYLYEQTVEGKKISVYHCSCCDCILKLSRAPPFDAHLPASSCVDRGCPLDVPGPISPPRPEALFQRASSIPHFTLGFPPLDSLLRPLSERRLVLFSGDYASTVAELAAFRAQLPVESGGLDSAVVFIDGGNRSDPYLFSSFARQRGVGPRAAMRRVASCRAFTLYQLAELVSERLARAAEDYGARLVIISDVLGTFNEPELDEREARRVLGAVYEGIEELKERSLVIATLPSPNKYDGLVVSWADTAISLSHRRDCVRAERLGRSDLAPYVATFKPNLLLKAARVGVRR
ncbi:MAG: hypothetical protein JRN11_06415 [Nitrososphaerota archaeon]|nr:hypothetical protein [Nitrososphaerota archaeon]MDG7026364.1 hypothetical protein [Nitrososphaerota archaeon]